ncbi:MAG: inositol monophosphatase [Actinomycetales bacterium]|nr:inositol monophosphatase [Actinomycetales bacterium]
MTELLDLARTLAVEAGDLAARRRREGVEVAATKSTVVDVVTAADREVEALIRGRLAELRPGDGFYGEESGTADSATGLTWVVDPIDGTVNYLYGIPAYAVSIAVAEGDLGDDEAWQPIAGCVVNAATGEVFAAERGAGAHLDGAPLRIGDGVPLHLALIGTGFAYRPEIRAEQGAVVAGLLPRVRDIRRIGSAALDLCAVATGRLDAYYERTLNPWDHAAGTLIVREAGGVVTGLAGAAPGRRAALAGPRGLVAELEAALVELGMTAAD